MNKGIIASALTMVLIVGIITSTAYAGYEHTKKEEYQRYLYDTFQESFYETAYCVSDVENMIAKIRLTNKANQSISMFAQLWKQAAAAQETLGKLPYSHSVIDNAQIFLSQTSDFAYSMMVKNIDGKDLTDEDRQKLEQLYEYAKKFSDQLNNMVSEIVMGNSIDWKEINLEESVENSENSMQGVEKLGSMVTMSKEFQEYPSLIYDGPFSAHIKSMEPKLTENVNQITPQEGMEKVKQFLGYENIAQVNFVGKTDEQAQTTIPVYTYSVILADKSEPEVYIDITQKGGYTLTMLNYADTADTEEEITLDEAKNKAKQFLDKNGYPDMEPSYYENSDGIAVINFAPVKNGVIMYPDLIKIKVDMKNGTIIGFESEGYITMHNDRQISSPSLIAAEARKYISDGFNVETVKLCVIPLDSKQEVMCYEFKGNYGDDNFLVYINTENGKQERILQLFISENAVLTE